VDLDLKLAGELLDCFPSRGRRYRSADCKVNRTTIRALAGVSVCSCLEEVVVSME
jgi:hypothetical protein